MLKRIKKLCDSRNMSFAMLEREAGLTRGSITKWDKSIPAIDKVDKVADFFEVSIDYLYGNTDNPKEVLGLSEEEREFLDTYAKAKQSDQEDIKDLLKIIDKKLNKDEG